MYGGMFDLEPMYPQLKETLTSMGNGDFVEEYENLDKPWDRYDEAWVQIDALKNQKRLATRSHPQLYSMIYNLIILWYKEIERLEKYAEDEDEDDDE